MRDRRRPGPGCWRGTQQPQRGASAGQSRRVVTDDFIGEAVVYSLFKRGACSDKTTGDEAGLEPLIALTRHDWIASPDPERPVAGDRCLQPGSWYLRKKRLNSSGERFGRRGVHPLLGAVERPHKFLEFLATTRQHAAAGVKARVCGRAARRCRMPEVTLAGGDQFLGEGLKQLHNIKLTAP